MDISASCPQGGYLTKILDHGPGLSSVPSLMATSEVGMASVSERKYFSSVLVSVMFCAVASIQIKKFA